MLCLTTIEWASGTTEESWPAQRPRYDYTLPSCDKTISRQGPLPCSFGQQWIVLCSAELLLCHVPKLWPGKQRRLVFLGSPLGDHFMLKSSSSSSGEPLLIQRTMLAAQCVALITRTLKCVTLFPPARNSCYTADRLCVGRPTGGTVCLIFRRFAAPLDSA